MRRSSTRVCAVSACNHTQTYTCACQHRSTGHQTCVHDGHTCTHIDAGTYASTRAHTRVTPERSGRQKGAGRRGHRASRSGSCTRTEQREAPRQKGEKQACAHLRPAHLRPDRATLPLTRGAAPRRPLHGPALRKHAAVRGRERSACDQEASGVPPRGFLQPRHTEGTEQDRREPGPGSPGPRARAALPSPASLGTGDSRTCLAGRRQRRSVPTALGAETVRRTAGSDRCCPLAMRGKEKGR